jgi:hypothetical protein
MKKLIVLCLLFIWGCGPDPIPDPDAVLLIAPENLNSCTTASRINETERQVRFQWTVALHADNYELIVQNSNTQERFTSNTELLNASIILPSGANYRWSVRSKSTLTPVTTDSQSWQFYLEGDPQTSHFPFPAQLKVPEDEAEISLNAANSFLFQWEGADLDEDIISYDFYLGQEPNLLRLHQAAISNSQITIELSSGSTYYWQIITRDAQQNESSSMVFVFQTE